MFLPDGPGDVKRLMSILNQSIGRAYSDKAGKESVSARGCIHIQRFVIYV